MNCDVIKDLMPLHIENLASEESSKLILEHVESCKDCRQTLLELQNGPITHTEENPDDLEKLTNTLAKKIKKNIYGKILISISIALIAGIIIGITRAKIFMFVGFLGTISIVAFTAAIFIGMVLCRKKTPLKKRFRALGNWTFVFSIVISLLSLAVFKWYFDMFNNMYTYLISLVVIYNIILSSALRVYARVKLSKGNIAGADSQSNGKLLTVTFSTLLAIIVVFSVPITILESGRNMDNIDMPFVNDSEVLGKWTAVGFVDKPEQFAPDRPSSEWKKFLLDMTFLENGSLKESFYDEEDEWNPDEPRPWMFWTKGYIIHKGGDHTASKYFIKDINGSKYMFFEWKDGEYSYLHKTPGYYVLEKEDAPQ